MLISDSHKFIFIHIRKVAGSSMRDSLAPLSLSRETSLKAKVKSRLLNIESDYHKVAFRAHSDILQVKKVMPKDLFDEYFKFAFVRNPWKRLVSEYEYIRRNPQHGRYNKVNKMSFNQYIKYQSKRPDAYQINMVADKDGILQIDFVGKFENLQEDWNYVCNKLNLGHKKLSHQLKASITDYSHYYDDTNKDLVSKLWKKDIEAFEYNFED